MHQQTWSCDQLGTSQELSFKGGSAVMTLHTSHTHICPWTLFDTPPAHPMTHYLLSDHLLTSSNLPDWVSAKHHRGLAGKSKGWLGVPWTMGPVHRHP
jgi:hypothetical protein